jgi:hypothetical protein
MIDIMISNFNMKLAIRKMDEKSALAQRKLCTELVEEKRRVANILSDLDAKWAIANALSLGMNLSSKDMEECKLKRNLPEEMKIGKVIQAIQLAWNDVCKGASKFVNSKQVIKIYLSFLFNLMIGIFDNFQFEGVGKMEKCQQRLEEIVWIWFQWRCGKIKDEDFLKEFEEVEKLGFKIPRMLSYEELKSLKDNMLLRDQFVSDKLVQKEAYPQDRYMLGGKEELDVNDIVKIHTKYYCKRKSKIELQTMKRKKRKKYRLKERNRRNGMKQRNASEYEQRNEFGSVKERKPPDKVLQTYEMKQKNASGDEQRNKFG